MKKALSLMLAAVLGVSFLLGACASPPSQLETIVFTEPVRGYHWAPVYLAETLGYFEEAGLKADFQTVSGADSSSAVFSGDAQFGLRGIEMALMANEAGNGCKVLVSTTSRYPYQLIGASEEYNTVESLRGKVIAGGQGPSSAPHAFSKAILLHAGIVPDEETAVISMASSGYVAAIKSGDIQAAVSTNPWSSKVLLENGGVVIVDGADEAAMNDLMGTTTYELFVLFATDEYIASNPETVQKTVTAVARAIQWMNEASPEEIANALEPLFEDQYEELLYSAQADQASQLHNKDGRHSASGFRAAQDLTKLSGAIKKDHDPSEIFDESFLDRAWEELS